MPINFRHGDDICLAIPISDQERIIKCLSTNVV